VLTTGVSLLVTAGDSVLLQMRRSYFTGGFLAADHVSGPMHGALFLLAAFAADVALLGTVVAPVWLPRGSVLCGGHLPV
jgi:hypothetical protein